VALASFRKMISSSQAFAKKQLAAGTTWLVWEIDKAFRIGVPMRKALSIVAYKRMLRNMRKKFMLFRNEYPA
jgi:hypothetical protein